MRVVIVEDQTMVRSLLESYFLAEDGNQIVASIPGAKQAVEVCRASPVDLVLMDVQTEHRENGLVAVRQIKAERPQIKIVVVTSLLDGAVLEEAKSAGADSLWYKDSAKNRLMEVVRRTMAGERVFPDAPPTVEIGMAKSTEFTKTEIKVLRHLLRGLSYTRIAAEMGCEMSTVAGSQQHQAGRRSVGRVTAFAARLVPRCIFRHGRGRRVITAPAPSEPYYYIE